MDAPKSDDNETACPAEVFIGSNGRLLNKKVATPGVRKHNKAFFDLATGGGFSIPLPGALIGTEKVRTPDDERLSSGCSPNQAEWQGGNGGMRTLILAAVVAMGAAWGCAGSGSSVGGPEPSDRNRITRAELEDMPSINAHEAVTRLHREWLRGRAGTIRSQTGRNYPEVFVNGRPYGPVDVLLQFGTDQLEEIRFISASDATTRYGTGYPAGIIELILRGTNVLGPEGTNRPT